MKICETCGANLFRRNGEYPYKFKSRRTCGGECWRALAGRQKSLTSALNPAPQKPQPSKPCALCGLPVTKRYGCGARKWNTTSYHPECSHLARAKPIAERLEDASVPEPNSGCWLWLGQTNNKGYSQISFDGKIQLAHRVVYSEYNKVTLSQKIKIRHKCDNRACINPAHLIKGTQKDNMQDASQRGRIRNHASGPLPMSLRFGWETSNA